MLRPSLNFYLHSKPLMDFIVTFCASNHLNPSDYTVDILSPNKSNISFKPNSTVGSLEAEKIVLKPKGMEEKPKGPYVPEVKRRGKSHKVKYCFIALHHNEHMLKVVSHCRRQYVCWSTTINPIRLCCESIPNCRCRCCCRLCVTSVSLK